MSELTERELWMIEVYFRDYGLTGSHDLLDLQRFLMRLGVADGRGLAMSLVQKNILSLSPDQRKVKFTDYGLEVYRGMKAAQDAWDRQPIVAVSSLTRDQIQVRAGEHFRANRILREILRLARSNLEIIDAYVGPELFDLIEDSGADRQVRVLTSDQATGATTVAYRAYRSQYQTCDMRISVGEIHDRYVVCDASRAYHIGHSLKDLGKKDTQINVVDDVASVVALFEARWSTARPV
jgi:hypothetical protein